MIIASQVPTIIIYNQNRIDFPPYTQCFLPPRAFIHGDPWGSFIVLD